MAKTIHPHVFASSDEVRRGDKYSMRFCDTCGLPELRADVHTLPLQDPDVVAEEERRWGR